MQQYRAKWVLPVGQPPIENGWVSTEAGRITAVGRGRAEWPAILAAHMDEAWAAKWLSWTLPIEPVDSSSTEVRRRVAEGADLGDLVLPAVGNYIASRGLYAKG